MPSFCTKFLSLVGCSPEIGRSNLSDKTGPICPTFVRQFRRVLSDDVGQSPDKGRRFCPTTRTKRAALQRSESAKTGLEMHSGAHSAKIALPMKARMTPYLSGSMPKQCRTK